MKHLIATALIALAAAPCLAQAGERGPDGAMQVAQSYNPGTDKVPDPGQGQTDNPGSVDKVTSPGRGVPCNGSAQSDRTGGQTKTSNSSTNNMGGGVKSEGC